MDKRGAYFFVIDALIAGAIILSALMFIYGTYTISPNQDATLRSADDFINYITSTRVREYDSELARNMTSDGNLTNLDNTLADQLVEFYYNPLKRGQLYNFTQDLASGLIPEDRGFLVLVNDSVIYNSTFHKSPSTMNASRLKVVSKIMNFKLINETVIYGPVWIEVNVWI